jgi:hypothetical protein
MFWAPVARLLCTVSAHDRTYLSTFIVAHASQGNTYRGRHQSLGQFFSSFMAIGNVVATSRPPHASAPKHELTSTICQEENKNCQLVIVPASASAPAPAVPYVASDIEVGNPGRFHRRG